METSWSPASSSSSSDSSFSTTEWTTEMETDNHSHFANYTLSDDIIYHPAVQAIFYLVYATIFVLGIFGNVLVCFVVGRNKAMQTVTNFFITNLALADILLCALAVPFTPLYTFVGEWIFGRILCHLVPYAQGTSVYISTLTLTSIAIDRFFVIIYPFKPRMKLTTCLLIITGIWAFALLVTLPYGIFLRYNYYMDKYTCDEDWPSEGMRQVFSGCTVTLQFVLPFIIMLFCYIKVSLKLSDRARAKPGSKNSKKEALERERKRRTNRMLIAMVLIFGLSWLPLNLFNFLYDVSSEAMEWKYSNLCFFIVHAVAMSSTCYNPFLYAWLNENFRKEFKQVLPCFQAPGDTANGNRSKRFLSKRTNCNGAEAGQETLAGNTPGGSQQPLNNAHPNTSASQSNNAHSTGGNTTVIQVLETIDELNSSSHNAPGGSADMKPGSASFNAASNEVIVHYPSPSFSSSSPPPSSSGGGGVAAAAPSTSSGGGQVDNVHCHNNNNMSSTCTSNPVTDHSPPPKAAVGAPSPSRNNRDVIIDINPQDNMTKESSTTTTTTTTTSTTIGSSGSDGEPITNESSTSPTDEDTNANTRDPVTVAASCAGNATVDMIHLKTFNVNTSVLN